MAFLRSFGMYVPERVVSNEELAPLLGVEAEWIVSQSGIRERRYAAEDETVVSLGHRAAVDCLDSGGIAAGDLGLVLVASGSTERFCPGPASSIAALLGLNGTPALDIPVASAGSLAAMVLAARLAETMGNVLVIGAEIMSRRIDRNADGKNTAILFGDGAGAVLISPDTGFARIADSCLHTDGNSAEALTISGERIHMDGAVVIRHASRRMPEAMNELLVRNNLPAEDVGVFLLHQANKNLITRIAQAVKVPAERFFANIDRYGNTSSASMLIAAAEWRAANAGAVEKPVMFSAFGMGLTWGAVLAVPALYVG
jgi:3-oxoacyl-[acyl-carrier-protein] synthase-3